jgi:hypothetical protein
MSWKFKLLFFELRKILRMNAGYRLECLAAENCIRNEEKVITDFLSSRRTHVVHVESMKQKRN